MFKGELRSDHQKMGKLQSNNLEFTHFFKATAIHLFSMSRFQSISAMMTFFLASMNYPRSQDQFQEYEKSVAFLLCFPVYYRLP